MANWRTFLALLALGVVTAGVFGALHNQLSYSVGASYFHDLKFPQFRIGEDLQNRLGAALVGWRASWWMGLVIGIPAFGLGLLTMKRRETFLSGGLSAIGAVLFVVLVGAMGGLILGLLAPSVASELPIPDSVIDTESYLRAALMHDGAYLGGLAGLPVAMMTIWRSARADRKNGGADE